MAKSQKRYLVLLVFGLLVIIAAGVWMVFGRKTQIYEKTEEIFAKNLLDDFTHNKSIQKIRESYRVPKESKERLQKMRRK